MPENPGRDAGAAPEPESRPGSRAPPPGARAIDGVDILVVSLVALVTGALLVLGGTSSSGRPGEDALRGDPCGRDADTSVERVDDAGFSEGAGLA